MSTTKMRCAECGKRAVTLIAKAGRTMPYKSMELEVPADVEIPTCEECGAEWIDDRTAKILDAALEKVYEVRLRERLEVALKRILEKPEVSQARVERVLGLSPGYLSKLKGERRNPSPALVAALAGLMPDPGERMNQIEKFMHGGNASADGGRKRASP